MLFSFQRKTVIQNFSGINNQQRNYAGAADLKILKRRQKTVTQIGKITGVLKVVAQSRLAAAQEKATRVTGFFNSANKVFEPITTKLLEKEDLEITTIIIYTDRGLCGPCNNGINRMLDKEALNNQNVVLWGEKGSAGFEKSKHKAKVLFSAHPNIKTPLSFIEVTNLVSKILEKECDIYRIIFNKMKGQNSSDIEEIWLPSISSIDEESARDILAPYELEAVSSDELLQNLNEFHLSSAINYAIFQNMVLCIERKRKAVEKEELMTHN